MENKHGQISWDDNSNFGGKNKKESNKDLWLKLKDGANILRLVTKPYQYLTHKGVKKEGEPGFGRKVPCSQAHGSCPLCAMDAQASPRYYFGVIDRAENRYKILDVSWSTFQDIKGFVNDPIWGDPMKYDINIHKDANHPTKYYTVKANPHTPLSPADQKLRDDADLSELDYKSTPLQPEVVQKIVDKALAGGTLAASAKKDATKKDKKGDKKDAKPVLKTKAAPVVETTAEEDNTDDIFPEFSPETEAKSETV